MVLNAAIEINLPCRVTLDDPAHQGQWDHKDKEFKDQR